MISLKSWLTNIPRQYRTHQNADLSLDVYLSHYREKFKKVKIGCSFAPDLVEQMYERENGERNISVQKKLQVLKILIHDFGMREIRLGIKWNKAVNNKGEFDFSYYQPYLDYCLSQKVNVCLNVGPIKTFGWPEEHIPKQITDSRLMMIDRVVDSDSSIAKYALEYLDILLQYIRSEYSKTQLQYLNTIQPENEAFNIYGKLRLDLSEDYLHEVVMRIVAVFPDKKILLSSAETRDVAKVQSVIRRCMHEREMSGNQFVMGINYYYNLPSFIKVPLLGPIDSITISNFIQKKTVSGTLRNARKLGYGVEVTEAQFEQWGKSYISPGNSHHEAKYLFARIIENILDPKVGGVIRLWGFERYAKKKLENKLTSDHQMNLELITKINNL